MSFKEMPLYLYTEPDFTLIVGESEIKVHEHIIAQSDFFKAAFRSGLKESRERRLELPEIELDTMMIALNWMYRVPPTPPLGPNETRYSPFSDESARKMKDILRAFDFLQMKDAGSDYVKFFEQYLRNLPSSTYFDATQWGNLISTLSETYRFGCPITEGALVNLFRVIFYVEKIVAEHESSLPTLNRALRELQDPDGECLRDVSLALTTVVMKHKRKEASDLKVRPSFY